MIGHCSAPRSSRDCWHQDLAKSTVFLGSFYHMDTWAIQRLVVFTLSGVAGSGFRPLTSILHCCLLRDEAVSQSSRGGNAFQHR